MNALGALRAKAAVPPTTGGVPEARDAAGGDRRPVPHARSPRALEVYIEGLGAKNPGVRDECRKALAAIRDEVRPQVRDRLACRHPAGPGRPRTRDHLRK